jgi:hypothetical protein
VADLKEHEERAIRDYVNSQLPADDQAGLVQRVHSQREPSIMKTDATSKCAMSRPCWVSRTLAERKRSIQH